MFGINGEILVDVKVSRTEAKDVLSVPLSHHFYKSHRVKMFMQDLHRSLSCFEAIFTNFNWFKIMRKNVRITRNVQFIRVAPVLKVQITGNNCLLHDGSLPSTAYRRHKNNCTFFYTSYTYKNSKNYRSDAHQKPSFLQSVQLLHTDTLTH